jgi:two-component system NtrC family response regulator
MKQHSKMLCVDDNDELRKNLAEQFVAEDFHVDTANDGDIALEMIKNNHYDIVLLDLKMKKMDGITVLKELKNTNKHPHIIMLTGVDDVQTAIECVKLGAKDYIQKPYDPQDLLHVVIKVLGS